MGAFFHSESLAKRYAKARPFFHPYVMELVGKKLSPSLPIEKALDVGCGTGHSSVALRSLATNVVGLDASLAMLNQARPTEGISYLEGQAEKMPFPDESFGLLAVGQAFHWFHRQAFYMEAARVLKDNGYLIIYSHALDHQCLDFFEKAYPSPFKMQPQIENEVSFFGFSTVERFNFKRTHSMTLEATIHYLLTLSNIEAAAQNKDLNEIERELKSQIAPNFTQNEIEFLSHGEIWILQKTS